MTNAVLHPSFFVVFHEFVLGSSIRQSHILAEGLPLAGNGKFPLDETTCSHFFEILFNFCLTRKLTFLAYRE